MYSFTLPKTSKTFCCENSSPRLKRSSVFRVDVPLNLKECGYLWKYMKEYCALEDSLKISMRATRHHKEGKGWYTITVQGPGGYEALEIALKQLLRWRPDFDIDAVAPPPPARLPPLASSAYRGTWSAALEPFRPRVPTKGPEHIRNYQTFWASPSEVHFTHDTIIDYFRDFKKDGKLMQDLTILDSCEVLAAAPTAIPKDLERIDVVWIDDRWYVAGTFNRRLCMFRLLMIYLPQDFPKFQVRRVPYDKVTWTLRDGRPKMSTTCKGAGVSVRPRPETWVGKTRSEVHWPDADNLFLKLQRARAC